MTSVTPRSLSKAIFDGKETWLLCPHVFASWEEILLFVENKAIYESVAEIRLSPHASFEGIKICMQDSFF